VSRPAKKIADNALILMLLDGGNETLPFRQPLDIVIMVKVLDIQR